jgi:hypothetical protein
MPEKEHRLVLKAVRKKPAHWVAQRFFKSVPLNVGSESFHLCIGVFTVDGKFAGFYGRISPYARIDANAKDIPILVHNTNSGSEQYARR